jgi:glycosyltransferase involved in cell wall biosynthesis
VPQDFLNSLVSLHEFFQHHDVKKSLEHGEVWSSFLRFLERDPVYKYIDLKEALTIYQVIQRNLQLLVVPVSNFDIIHSSLAWFPSLLALIAKAKHGTPFLLTEHGVAFKELILYYNSVLRTEASSIFWKNFSVNIIRAIYTFADTITPVCYANAKWEKYLGVDSSKINVIYNGVDISRFKPNINTEHRQNIEAQGKKENRPPFITKNRDSGDYYDDSNVLDKQRRPTVIFVGRVDPFKDIVNLLLCIHYIRKSIPNILCKVYGTAHNVEYAQRCMDTMNRYGLQHNVMFMGSTQSPEAAYAEADIVIMTSVTEGFPFSIIEAMACGKAIVAANVGGVAEALDGCGLLITGRHPYTFANALLKILKDKELKEDFSISSQIIVRTKFNLQNMIKQYEQQYQILKTYLYSRSSEHHYGESIT